MSFHEFLSGYREYTYAMLRWIGRSNLCIGYLLALIITYGIGLSSVWMCLVFVWIIGIYLAVGLKLVFNRWTT